MEAVADLLGFHLDDRFWPFVEKGVDADDCWLWQGRLTSKGYAAVRLFGGHSAGHVLSWEVVNGPVPDLLVLDHTRRTRACVNPGHLEPVTHAENIRRGHEARTHCKYGHRFDFMRSDGHRGCSECKRRRNREYRVRKAKR